LNGKTFQRSQQHPLHDHDRIIVDRLLAADGNDKQDVVDAARLFIRYDGANGSHDIQHDLINVLARWGTCREELNRSARQCWASQEFRPDYDAKNEVGSGADPGNT